MPGDYSNSKDYYWVVVVVGAATTDRIVAAATSLGIERVFLPLIIQSLQLLLSHQRVVVNVDLAVNGKSRSFFGDDKRVDLRQGAVLSREDPVQCPHERHDLF